MHQDEIDVDVATVRQLVADQLPHLSHLPVRAVETAGTVNVIVRIGDHLAARFPRQAADPEALRESLEAEAAAARELAHVSTVPAPEPVAVGKPGRGYPLPWSVQTWLVGTDATESDPEASDAFAHDLAGLLTSLRAADTRGRRFGGAGRGGDLRDQDAWMQTCFVRSENLLDVPRLRGVWARLRVLPRTGPDVMSHRDLIPGNVLVENGRLAGLLDGGDFGPADPALDLVSAWHLLDRPRRAQLRRLLGSDDVEWARGAAWAFAQAMGLVWYYLESNPVMARVGRRTLSRVLEEF
ncbi:aminoglycoside phosphotransferase family protein [Georgenia deserti]|uniref:Aminoglycoside phosphotransferase family protein n=1 Tax=Georgenia deserti TaxID=2093781 RepID=A0ABW4L9C2_9MICO